MSTPYRNIRSRIDTGLPSAKGKGSKLRQSPSRDTEVYFDQSQPITHAESVSSQQPRKSKTPIRRNRIERSLQYDSDMEDVTKQSMQSKRTVNSNLSRANKSTRRQSRDSDSKKVPRTKFRKKRVKEEQEIIDHKAIEQRKLEEERKIQEIQQKVRDRQMQGLSKLSSIEFHNDYKYTNIAFGAIVSTGKQFVILKQFADELRVLSLKRRLFRMFVEAKQISLRRKKLLRNFSVILRHNLRDIISSNEKIFFKGMKLLAKRPYARPLKRKTRVEKSQRGASMTPSRQGSKSQLSIKNKPVVKPKTIKKNVRDKSPKPRLSSYGTPKDNRSKGKELVDSTMRNIEFKKNLNKSDKSTRQKSKSKLKKTKTSRDKMIPAPSKPKSKKREAKKPHSIKRDKSQKKVIGNSIGASSSFVSSGNENLKNINAEFDKNMGEMTIRSQGEQRQTVGENEFKNNEEELEFISTTLRKPFI